MPIKRCIKLLRNMEVVLVWSVKFWAPFSAPIMEIFCIISWNYKFLFLFYIWVSWNSLHNKSVWPYLGGGRREKDPTFRDIILWFLEYWCFTVLIGLLGKERRLFYTNPLKNLPQVQMGRSWFCMEMENFSLKVVTKSKIF